MKLERSDIEFPIWRKKVDATLFKNNATPIPKWLWKVWNINELFSDSTSKQISDCNVLIRYEKDEFEGRVIFSMAKNMFRLFFSKKLGDNLRDVFLMSYMRSIEQDLRKGKPEYNDIEIEEDIPFWEFLDIEFDCVNKIFKFRAYYVQKPAYLELFKELVKSHTLKIIEDKLNLKGDFQIAKQDWLHRENLKNQIDAKNVIYNLIDTINKQIYIGEAESLINRLNQQRPSIKDWDYYRYDCLPEGLTKSQRVAIERLLIRTFAAFFENKKGIKSMKVSNYSLTNDKIDL